MGGARYFFNKLDVSVTTQNTEIKSGQTVDFSVKYDNKNNYQLEDVVLSFNFPENFILDTVDRSDFDSDHNIIKIGDLPPGANGNFTVTGQVVGSLDQEQNFYVNLNYYKTDKRGERLWGQFDTNGFANYSINSSYLELGWQPIGKVLNNQTFTWQMYVINNSSKSENISFENITIKPVFDEDSVMPIGKETITIKKLLPGERVDSQLQAKINSEESSLDLKALVFQDVDVLQAKNSETLEILQPNFEVNHSPSHKGAITPGETVDFTLTYDNKGDFSLEDVTITVFFEGDYWDINKYTGELGTVVKNAIVFTSSDISKLKLLQPNEKGQINFSIKTKSYANSQDLDLRSHVQLRYRVNGVSGLINTSYRKSQLNSNLSMQIYPMYFAKTGDQLGRGPIPPYVGEETKYWVFGKIINDIHDVDNVKFSAKLPFNVVWTDKSNVPVGDAISYDATSKTVSWQISKIPSSNGNFGLAFELAIIPTAPQRATFPTLLSNITISGTDSVTGESIEKNLGNISTRLIYDERGKLRDGAVE